MWTYIEHTFGEVTLYPLFQIFWCSSVSGNGISSGGCGHGDQIGQPHSANVSSTCGSFSSVCVMTLSSWRCLGKCGSTKVRFLIAVWDRKNPFKTWLQMYIISVGFMGPSRDMSAIIEPITFKFLLSTARNRWQVFSKTWSQVFRGRLVLLYRSGHRCQLCLCNNCRLMCVGNSWSNFPLASLLRDISMVSTAVG